MIKLILFFAFNIIAFCSWGQVTSLNENFDVACVFSYGSPSGWQRHNPITSTLPYGLWSCSPTGGRPDISGPAATPGMQCSDTSGGMHHLDTAFLLTPFLDLSSYPQIFLQFDSKTDIIHLGSELSVILATDSANPYSPGGIDITTSLTPLFSNGDSTGWVTHVADLTPYKSALFYVLFRYTSTDTSGSIWFLDNVKTVNYNITLGMHEQDKDEMKITVLGTATTDQVNYSYTAPSAGQYKLALSDLTGRVVCREDLLLQNGTSSYQLSGLSLHPGMYFLSIRNDHAFATTKVIVQ